MMGKRNKTMKLLLCRCLAAFLLLLVPSMSLAAEKYNICVYDINYNVTGASPESAAEIEKDVLTDLSKRDEFNLISKDNLKSLVGLYSKDGKVGEAGLIETAKFAGIDYFLLLNVSGEVKTSSDKLEELFDQNGSHPLQLGLKILDIAHNETAWEANNSVDNMTEVRAEIKKEISDLKLKYKRGKVEKVSDSKIAVNLGQNDGVVVGQKAAIYKAQAIKVGKINLSVPGEKAGDAVFEKVVKDRSMMAMEGSPEVKVGDFVEIMTASQPIDAKMTSSSQENTVVVGGQAKDGFVVVPAKKPFTSAESRLKDFAKKAEEGRMQSAMYGVGLGLLYISLGSAYSGSYYGSNYSSIYYGLGAGMTILGVRSYLFPTELENNYNKIRQMTSSTVEERGAREAFAERSLKQGADEAQQGRTISAGILAGVGLLSGSGSVGLIYVGLGAMSYIMKSDIEKAYDEYKADKEDFIKNPDNASRKND